jgi:hypothetical protein
MAPIHEVTYRGLLKLTMEDTPNFMENFMFIPRNKHVSNLSRFTMRVTS